MGTKKLTRKGDPDPDRISTSYVERQNLTMRMGMRRFTRLTNGFSRKVENLADAISLHFMHYFARPHASLELPKQFLLTPVESPQHEEQASSNQRALIDPDQSLRLRRQSEAKDIDDRQADNDLASNDPLRRRFDIAAEFEEASLHEPKVVDKDSN